MGTIREFTSLASGEDCLLSAFKCFLEFQGSSSEHVLELLVFALFTRAISKVFFCLLWVGLFEGGYAPLRKELSADIIQYVHARGSYKRPHREGGAPSHTGNHPSLAKRANAEGLGTIFDAVREWFFTEEASLQKKALRNLEEIMRRNDDISVHSFFDSYAKEICGVLTEKVCIGFFQLLIFLRVMNLFLL
uniref:Uncharacterized protein n=1 Tax=Parascaris equorum TaxID=6256 RepID=A0A914RKR4_PAREQ